MALEIDKRFITIRFENKDSDGDILMIISNKKTGMDENIWFNKAICELIIAHLTEQFNL